MGDPRRSESPSSAILGGWHRARNVDFISGVVVFLSGNVCQAEQLDSSLYVKADALALRIELQRTVAPSRTTRHSRMKLSLVRRTRLYAAPAIVVAIACVLPVRSFAQSDDIPRPAVDLKPGSVVKMGISIPKLGDAWRWKS